MYSRHMLTEVFSVTVKWIKEIKNINAMAGTNMDAI
jgi:hypothetical protein